MNYTKAHVVTRHINRIRLTVGRGSFPHLSLPAMRMATHYQSSFRASPAYFGYEKDVAIYRRIPAGPDIVTGKNTAFEVKRESILLIFHNLMVYIGKQSHPDFWLMETKSRPFHVPCKPSCQPDWLPWKPCGNHWQPICRDSHRALAALVTGITSQRSPGSPTCYATSFSDRYGPTLRGSPQASQARFR